MSQTLTATYSITNNLEPFQKYRLRAITCDTELDKAKQLEVKVEVVQGDLLNRASLETASTGAQIRRRHDKAFLRPRRLEGRIYDYQDNFRCRCGERCRVHHLQHFAVDQRGPSRQVDQDHPFDAKAEPSSTFDPFTSRVSSTR